MAEPLAPLKVTRRSGAEPFVNGESDLAFTVGDFWQWSSSDLASNALRGRLAEFLVAQAAGVAGGVRSEWDAHDLTLPSGLKIEVKASAYLQSWAQVELSVPSFDIRPTRAWDASTNALAPESDRRRQAELYVFALQRHREKRTYNALDVSQWEFYVVPTSTLDASVGKRQRLSLAALQSLAPHAHGFADLGSVIRHFDLQLS